MGHESPSTSKQFRTLTLVTSGWLLLLIFVGAIAQVTNAGIGCPDWFLCNQQATPSLAVTTWLDFTHHIVATMAAFLTFLIAFFIQRDYQHYRLLSTLALGTLILAFGQVILVAGTVWFDYHPVARVTYLVIVLLYLAFMLMLTVVAHLPANSFVTTSTRWADSHKSFFRLLIITGAALLFLLFSGITVTATGTAAACPDWPLCRGQLVPLTADPGVYINLFHRFSVVFVSLLIAAVVLRSYRQFAAQRHLSKWAAFLGLLYLSQVAVGGWSVLMPLPRVVTIAIHLTLTATIWGCLVILATRFYFLAQTLPVETTQATPNELTLRQRAGIYFKLTKPWIMALLLITTVTAMFIAAKGAPPLALILLTVLGGALSAGGASVLNSYVDSDIDQLMSRTSRRATVTGLVTPQETLRFGLILSTLSFFVFALFVNTLSAALSTLGILYYVFFYTLYLKRATLHNIIIGGAAGAIPPLVGWTAVTGLLDLGAFYLFAIIFFWTPPHTWALALLVKKDYTRARVPMLPVVVGEKETTYQIFLYTILLVTLTLLPVTFNMLSLVYLVAAIALGLPFLYLAWKLWRNYDKRYSKQLYKFSQLYLALLFLVMAVDRTFFV